MRRRARSVVVVSKCALKNEPKEDPDIYVACPWTEDIVLSPLPKRAIPHFADLINQYEDQIGRDVTGPIVAGASYGHGKGVCTDGFMTGLYDTATHEVEVEFMAVSEGYDRANPSGRDNHVFLTPDSKYIVQNRVVITEEDLKHRPGKRDQSVVTVFCASEGKVVKHIQPSNGEDVRRMEVTSDGLYVVMHEEDGATYIARIEDLVRPGDVDFQSFPWVAEVPTVFRSAALSYDGKRFLVAGSGLDSTSAWIVDLETSKVSHEMDIPFGVRTVDVCLDLAGNEIVSRKVEERKYARRCTLYARLLLRSLDSLFADRMKLSVWLQPDVFADAITCPQYGMTRKKALSLIGKEIYEADGMGDSLKAYCGV
jgi:hypothetical protein